MNHYHCERGKQEWLDTAQMFTHEFQVVHELIITTKCKSNWANPDVLLIDDNEKNIKAFRAKGGQGILFPCLHNSLHQFANNPVEGMAKGIYDLLKELN